MKERYFSTPVATRRTPEAYRGCARRFHTMYKTNGRDSESVRSFFPVQQVAPEACENPIAETLSQSQRSLYFTVILTLARLGLLPFECDLDSGMAVPLHAET